MKIIQKNCLKIDLIKIGQKVLTLFILLLIKSAVLTGQGDTSWMIEGKYGIFMHYQYRILLGYRTPALPDPSQMNAEEWNGFVNGFDVEAFARQMEEGGISWVLFCLDDTNFGYTCSPNATFNKYTGYKPGERCSHRDLPMELADALQPKGIRLLLYWSGLTSTEPHGEIKHFGYVSDLKSYYGQKKNLFTTDPEMRKIAIEIVKEWSDRYKEKVAGWWFDGFPQESSSGWTDSGTSPTLIDLAEAVRSGNPESIIAFNIGSQEKAFKRRSIVQDYTAGDAYFKSAGNIKGGGLSPFTPEKIPAEGGILWNAKPFIGNIYYGLGTGLSYTDQIIIDWLKTIISQGGVATLDYPFWPENGLLKNFAIDQLIEIARVVKMEE